MLGLKAVHQALDSALPLSSALAVCVLILSQRLSHAI